MRRICVLFAAALACAVIALAPATAGASSSSQVSHSLKGAAAVSISLTSPGEHRAMTLLRFPRNRVFVRRLADGRLTVVARRGHRLTPARKQRRQRVRVILSLAESTVTARVGARRVTVKVPLRAEKRVIVARAARPVVINRQRQDARSVGERPAGAAPAVPERKPQLTASTPKAATTSIPPRLFASDSVWTKPLASNAALDAENVRLTRTLRDQVAVNIAALNGPWIATKTTSPLYTVPANQPLVRVQLDNGGWATGLQQAFAAVPIPANAAPAEGTDRHLTIWQPSTDRLWEFFRAGKQSDGWHAAFGGADTGISRSPGYFTTTSWPGLSQPWWGATATSLPVIAGTMMLSEMRAGVIPHALAINIPNARQGVYSWPAQRSDGKSTSPTAIPEGARFRLDPTLDISKLNLPPLTRMMAVAAQRYGMIVRDQTSVALAFFAENWVPYGTTNPYTGTTGIFGGKTPVALMRSFPWDRLQLLKMSLTPSH